MDKASALKLLFYVNDHVQILNSPYLKQKYDHMSLPLV